MLNQQIILQVKKLAEMSQIQKLITLQFIQKALINPRQDQKCHQMHGGSCDGKAMSQFVEGCKGTYKMYLLVHLIPLLTLRRKKLQQNPLRQLKKLMVGLVKSMLFAGGYSMLVRRVICLLTKYYSFNYVIAYISGVVGGLSLVFEPISRQSQISLYTLNKSMEVLYNMGLRRKLPVKLPYGLGLLNAISLAIICFTYMEDPDVWRMSYRRVLDKFLNNI